MIVFNEENNLARCLSSITHIADEVVIVDTGSTDNTVQIANAFQAKVIPYVWEGDFSAARNFALDHATKEWILVLDADEILQGIDITPYMENNDVGGYMVRFLNYYGHYDKNSYFTDFSCRLFRNHPSIRFQGAIHEEISTSLKTNGWNIKNSEITLHHFGYIHNNEKKQRKHERNVSIINKSMIATPKDPRLTYALGVEYLQAEKYKKAYDIFMQLLRGISPSADYAPDIVLKSVHLLRSFQKNEEALELAEQGLEHYSDFADLYDAKAAILMDLHHYPAAIHSLEQSCSCPAHTFYSSQAGTGSFRTLYTLGEANEKLFNFETAVEHYRASLNTCPAYQPAWGRYLLWSTAPFVSTSTFINDIKNWKDSLQTGQWLTMMKILVASSQRDKWETAKQHIPEPILKELHVWHPLAEALTLSIKGQKKSAASHLIRQKKTFHLEEVLFIWCVYYEESLDHQKWLETYVHDFSLIKDLYTCMMQGYNDEYKGAVTLAKWMFLEGRMVNGYIRFTRSLDSCNSLPLIHLYLFPNFPAQDLEKITDHLSVNTEKQSVEECLAISLLQLKCGKHRQSQKLLKKLMERAPSSPLPRLVTLLSYQSKTASPPIIDINNLLTHLTCLNNGI